MLFEVFLSGLLGGDLLEWMLFVVSVVSVVCDVVVFAASALGVGAATRA